MKHGGNNVVQLRKTEDQSSIQSHRRGTRLGKDREFVCFQGIRYCADELNFEVAR
ncbi:hypothetical protein LCGC14_0220370 [marine sediment metagenome]|uniref:Uncharacterized protein n=1 Tax=marine sediment metagenome TaxID=412755 RepID=A0A0F9WXL5_9ZZZZ